MLIHLIHVREVKATATGKVLKDVVCEKCRADFQYELVRVGKGSWLTLYGMFKGAAQERANNRARRDLQKRLEREVELVPCPKCRWVNEAMTRASFGKKYRSWLQLCVAIVVATVLVDVFFYYAADSVFGHRKSVYAKEIWMAGGIGFAAVCVILLLREIQRARFDPNRSGNGKPRVPPGTPPAIMKQVSASGAVEYVRVASTDMEGKEVTWAVFRAGELVLEPMCCECLDAANCAFELPMAFSKKALGVPLCLSCQRGLRGRWWRSNVVMVGVGFGISWLLSRLPTGIDSLGRLFMAIFLSVVLGLIGVAVVEQWVKPYRLRVVDEERGVSKVWFRNPAYTAILIRKMGLRDGIYKK